MVPGYKYIAMAREPVSWFKSAVTYFGKTRQTLLINGVPPVSKIYVGCFNLSSVMFNMSVKYMPL